MSSEVPGLPSVASLASLDAIARARVLDLLFEPSTPLHTLSVTPIAEQHFTTYPDLITFVGRQFTELLVSNLASDQVWLDSILGAHPRLGEKKVDSALSRQEQAAMKAAEPSTNDDAEAESVATKLAELNQEYESAFPGLRYVTFVNGRPRSVIMEDMKQRINRADARQERVDAIKVCYTVALDLTAPTD